MNYEEYQEQLKKLLEEPGRDLVTCSSCGDSYPLLVRKKLTWDKCPDCYAEIHFQKAPQPAPPVPGARGSRSPDPSWDNAVRSLEDNL